MSAADLYRNRGVKPLAEATRTFVIQCAADTHISYSEPTVNKSTQTTLEVTNFTNWHRKTLLKFDILSIIPAGFTVKSARLQLRPGFIAAGAVNVYRLLRTDWVEAQATWNIYKTGSNWGTAGCAQAATDYTVTDMAISSISVVTDSAWSGWMEWDVTAQVLTAMASTGGVAHFLIWAAVAAALDWTFYSRDHSDTGARPRLVVFV
jgi:hypothetical protein